MRLVCLGAAIVALLAVSAPAQAAPPRAGDYVGRAGRMAMAVVVGDAGVTAYVCNGRRVGTWFRSDSFERSRRTLKADGRRLRVRSVKRRLRVRLGKRVAVLRRAPGRAGLYRSESRVDGALRLAGWIVERSARQTGVVATDGIRTTAPRLSTTTLTADSLVAAPVLAPADPLAVVLDLDGDGLDASGEVTTSLLGGGARTARWTRAGDDDAFIGFDAAVLRLRGYSVPGSGLALARGGLTVTRDDVTTTTVDGFHMLRLLDGNGDGILSPADPAWEAARVLGDRNGDGTFSAAGGDLIADMAAMNMEFLRLQSAVQTQSRLFAILSNASRARREVALGAIRNIK